VFNKREDNLKSTVSFIT